VVGAGVEGVLETGAFAAKPATCRLAHQIFGLMKLLMQRGVLVDEALREAKGKSPILPIPMMTGHRLRRSRPS
jgi:hypothetical protein